MYTKHVFKTCIQNLCTEQCIQYNVYKTMYIDNNAYKTCIQILYTKYIYKPMYTK